MPIRRLALAALAVLSILLPSAALTLPSGDALSFSVFRKNDSPLGSHRVRFIQDGDRLIMEKEIRLEVTLAFVKAYSYHHVNREVWQAGRLMELDTRTDDDGDAYWVRGRATPEGFQVEGSGGSFLAPADIIPTSYWNPATLQATRLLDTQRGLIMDVRMEDRGEERVETAAGPVQARHHTINILTNPPGKTDRIELWYDGDQRWVALSFKAKGQAINYVLDQPAIPPSVPLQAAEAPR